MSGISFWEDHGKDRGRIVQQQTADLIDGDDRAGIIARGAWLTSSGQPVVQESREIWAYPLSAGEWMLVIDLLLLSPLGPVISRPGQPWLSVLLWLGTVVVSVVFAEIVSRTPLSLPLTGRRFEPRRPAPEGTPS